MEDESSISKFTPRHRRFGERCRSKGRQQRRSSSVAATEMSVLTSSSRHNSRSGRERPAQVAPGLANHLKRKGRNHSCPPTMSSPPRASETLRVARVWPALQAQDEEFRVIFAALSAARSEGARLRCLERAVPEGEPLDVVDIDDTAPKLSDLVDLIEQSLNKEKVEPQQPRLRQAPSALPCDAKELISRAAQDQVSPIITAAPVSKTGRSLYAVVACALLLTVVGTALVAGVMRPSQVPHNQDVCIPSLSAQFVKDVVALPPDMQAGRDAESSPPQIPPDSGVESQPPLNLEVSPPNSIAQVPPLPNMEGPLANEGTEVPPPNLCAETTPPNSGAEEPSPDLGGPVLRNPMAPQKIVPQSSRRPSNLIPRHQVNSIRVRSVMPFLYA